MIEIPFNRPYTTGNELGYIQQAIEGGHLSGGGPFSRRCCRWLEDRIGSACALLTHSCTGALELSAMLAEIGPGDEVIMPSFTFVSTANAFVLRGAVPVFVDIRRDTLNIDETAIEAAVTARTKAIVPVHYAGVGCAMDEIALVAERHGLLVLEDAAQGLMSGFKGRPLGSFSQLASVSFHETKNVIAGEGGALLVNDPGLVERAEILQEKGTNRQRFFRGQVDKYSWMDIGGSYPPSEINAAFLWAQLEAAESITDRRLAIWQSYHDAFAALEESGRLRRPTVPAECTHNAHMYYLVLRDLETRTRFVTDLAARGVQSVFHYVPLHTSNAGLRFGRAHGELPVTVEASDCLVRLPLWLGMDEAAIDCVVSAVYEALGAPLARDLGRLG